MDLKKDIGTSSTYEIGYHFNNLPSSLTFRKPDGTVSYKYYVAGTKVKKVVTESGQPTKTILYLLGNVRMCIMSTLINSNLLT